MNIKYTVTIRSKDKDGNETVEKVTLPIGAENVSDHLPNREYVYLAIIEPTPTAEIVADLERWIDKHSNPHVASAFKIRPPETKAKPIDLK